MPLQKIIREPRQLSVASAGLLEPPLELQVEDAVQVDIRKHRADGPTLRYTLGTQSDHTVLHHAGLQPLVQKPDQSRIVDPMPYEFPEPRPVD